MIGRRSNPVEQKQEKRHRSPFLVSRCPPFGGESGSSSRATPGLRHLLPICGGFDWVRFFWRIGVFRVENAVSWVRFVILRLGVKPVLPCSCGLAFPCRRTRALWAARRPHAYITPRVIAQRGGSERTGGLCLASDVCRVSPPHRFANEMGRQTPSLVPLRTRTCQINLLLR